MNDVEHPALSIAMSPSIANFAQAFDAYYVYAHVRLSGDVFYVGKGSGQRISHTGNRSAYWKRVVAKHGYQSVILEANLTEQEAYQKEIDWIAFYKSIGQCGANFTLGGDGVRVEKRWWGEKIGRSMKGKKKPSGIHSMHYKDFMPKDQLLRMYLDEGLTTTQIATNCGVTPATVAGRLQAFGIQVRLPGRRTVRIMCDTDQVAFSSISEAARHYGLFRENISKVLRGQYATTGGMVFSYIQGE